MEGGEEMMAVDVKVRGDRFSPVLREKKKLVQLPKDVRDKISATDPDLEEKKTPRYLRKS